MSLGIFLLFLYGFLCCYAIHRSLILHNKDIPSIYLIAALILKVLVGTSYGIIHLHYFKGGDTFLYLEEANLLASTFFQEPIYYLKSLIGLPVDLPQIAVFEYPTTYLFWKDFGTYFIVHLHALLNVFAWQQYQVHLLFINLISLRASLYFYESFKHFFRSSPPVLSVFFFLMPSLLFWTSGLHKDAWLFLAMSLIFKALQLQDQGQLKRSLRYLLSGLFLVLCIRHYIFALLLPPLLAYGLNQYYKKAPWTCYFTVYTASFFLGHISCKVLANKTPWEILALKQQAFLSEIGGSDFAEARAFSPELWDFLLHLPQAFINVCFRPYIWEVKDFLQLLSSLETTALCSLLGIAIYRVLRQQKSIPSPLFYFGFFFALSLLLLIGLLVSNMGTIVRYRTLSLYLLASLSLVLLQQKKSQ